MALSGGERNAIGRALARGGAAAVARVRYGLYRVGSASRPGTAHTVSVDPQGRYRCDCEAGTAGRACWHAAAVLIAKVEHAGGVRVTGPGRRPTALPDHQRHQTQGRGEPAATGAPTQPQPVPAAA